VSSPLTDGTNQLDLTCHWDRGKGGSSQKRGRGASLWLALHEVENVSTTKGKACLWGVSHEERVGAPKHHPELAGVGLMERMILQQRRDCVECKESILLAEFV